MGEEHSRDSASIRAVEHARREHSAEPASATAARRHSQVPTECGLCGAAEFSAVIEVSVGASHVLHWVSPPTGWYLLREARPEPGAPLLHGRCPRCIERVLQRR